MDKDIFVSHASSDKETAERLCTDLSEHDVEVWASFKDISPGEEWDQSIQDALDAAAYVLLIVSMASIDSSYVRSEIEYALDNKKIVIPVLIEKVKLPLRWHTLQYVDLSDDQESTLKLLVDKLPKSGVATLRQLLADPNEFQSFQELMWNNPQWIGYDALSRKHFALLEGLSNEQVIPKLADNLDQISNHVLDSKFNEHKETLSKKFTPGTNEKRLKAAFHILYLDLLNSVKTSDFFYINQITFGANIALVYLCSPYAPLFNEQGDQERFHQHIQNAETFMDDFAQKVTPLSKHYIFQNINALVLSGQRQQYTKALVDKRNQMSVTLNEFSSGRNTIVGSLEIVSYDRFLERVIV